MDGRLSSRHAAIELDWADGTYTFRLGLSELEEVERKCDKSIFQIASDLGQRQAKMQDIREVIRLGMIGGGTSPIDALATVRKYLDERPLDESRDVAHAVALAALMRLEKTELEADEVQPGKKQAPSKGRKSSTLAQSTQTPQ